MLLNDWAEQGALSRVAAVVVFIGALSAIMSTADSCLLSLGSLLARDVLLRTGNEASQTRLGKILAGAVLLATVPLALQQDVTLWRLIELKMEILIQCVPAFLMALHYTRQSAEATLAGLVVGTLFSVGFTLMDVPRIAGVHVGVLGLVLNGLVVLAVSARPLPSKSPA